MILFAIVSLICLVSAKNTNNKNVCKTKEGLPGRCNWPTLCFSQYNDISDYVANLCFFDNGIQGICCPYATRATTIKHLPIHIPSPYTPSVRVNKISFEDIDRATQQCIKLLNKFSETENNLILKGFFQIDNASQPSPYSTNFDPLRKASSRAGSIALCTTLKIKKMYNLSIREARDGLSKYSLSKDLVNCSFKPKCPKSKYRNIDGSCNNLRDPLWAQSNTAFTRLVAPAYADGVNKPRISVTGAELPNVRLVSSVAATNKNMINKKLTIFFMQWGQFMDHDLTQTVSTVAQVSRKDIFCCDDKSNKVFKHPSCSQIAIPKMDSFYSQFNQTCMNFVRKAPSMKPGCSLGFREQMNGLTSVIDGNMVYGPTLDRASHLRSFKGGKLRVSTVSNVDFLPFDTQNRSDECGIPAKAQPQFHCFVTGDTRANVQTGLTMIHNVLLREHNRIADILQKLNPEWSDEIVYQETRRIVAAEIQHITYNEWLPLVLGRSVMLRFKILPKSYLYTNDYSSKTNPNVINSFATAAFRMHTLVPGFYDLLNAKGEVTQKLQLRNLLNDPTSIYRSGAYDEFLNGFTNCANPSFDKFFTQELTNHLFQAENLPYGMDLVSVNIQRGRDHGLPGYNEFRRVCGLKRINSFKNLAQVMQNGSAQILSTLYKSVDDIDLFIAGNHEIPLADALVGPTFACIIAEQFRRAKVGDRFWYENANFVHSFSKNQLQEIRKASLARLICDNSGVQSMQVFPFMQPIGWNKRIACNNIATVNLNFWKGEKIFDQQ